MTRRARTGILQHLTWACAALFALCVTAQAQGLGAQARLDPAQSRITSDAAGLSLELAVSQPVPFRLRMLTAPPRAVLDVNTLDWAQAGALFERPGTAVRSVRTGRLPDGWARLVFDLSAPYLPRLTEQVVDAATGQAVIRVMLDRADLSDFEARALSDAQFTARNSDLLLHPDAALPAPVGPRRPVVLLDPGHGGIDPGAERDGVREADIVLTFARILREELVRRGAVDVVLSRDSDDFVSLDGRLRAARAAQADVFVSIHADAVPEGLATGAVIYLLSEDASDEAAAYLAERHDRADLLSGVDLADNTDEIARVLMSLTWQDTAPRAQALAGSLVEGMRAGDLRLHRRPIQGAAFNVLRAPDMPSVLVELGFMSSPRDLANLRDPAWQARMAVALADGLDAWLLEDRALQALRRN